MTHHKQAEKALDDAINSQLPENAGAFASISTAHGILALIDLLQSEITVSDDGMPSFEETVQRDLEDENKRLTDEIRTLELTIQRIENFTTEWERRGLDTILIKDLRGIIDNPLTITITSDSETADTILQPKVK